MAALAVQRWVVALAGLLGSLLGPASAMAQTGGAPPDTTRAYTYVEQMPTLPGGGSRDDLVRQIQRLLVLPAGTADGYSVVTFVVGPSGAIREAKITRGSTPAGNAAVLAAVARLPRLVPGRQNGQPLSVQLTLPIPFVGPQHVYAPGEPNLGPANYPFPAAPMPDSTKEWLLVEAMPRLPDGRPYTAAHDLVQRALVLPANLRANDEEGIATVCLTVGASGVAYNVRLAHSISPAADAAVVTALARLPRWQPGRRNGQPVAVPLRFPIAVMRPDHVYAEYELRQLAQFPAPGLEAYVRSNLRLPAEVTNGSQKGVTEINYVVGEDGRVRDAYVNNGLCPTCDQEALRLVRTMPIWQPARTSYGQPAATRKTLQINMPPNAEGASYEPGMIAVRGSTDDFDEDSHAPGQHTYTAVSQMPQLATGGGRPAVIAAIQKRVVLAAPARQRCGKGTVTVAFTVEITGTPTGAYIVRGLGPECDAAVLAAVRHLPRFRPGQQGDQLERVLYTVELPLGPPPPAKR
ncbi:energy transducer TonB [Hymenobacter sp. DH14]|uniref:Energy transducer TonB n=1 Tax=Hymenobacter cyanobacteriorum TaxID=2926463 RepID=A0A9X1VEM6_9BACT|nr:energy transducer TonB [Hymenobacter cyanobacteriorum]MCI1186693.1 energy transducer TonB [Hymenobacter cyanobacteriorum]